MILEQSYQGQHCLQRPLPIRSCEFLKPIHTDNATEAITSEKKYLYNRSYFGKQNHSFIFVLFDLMLYIHGKQLRSC